MTVIPRGIGPRFSLALILFALVVGGATAAVVYAGFDRSREAALDRSRDALELQSRTTLATFAESAAGLGEGQIAPAAEFAQLSARYIYNLKASGAAVPWDAATLERRPSGLFVDANPSRVTDVAVLKPDDPIALRDLRDTAALDAIAPTLFAEYPDRYPGAGFQPIALFFVGTTWATRYYPRIGLFETTVPTAEGLEGLLARLGPEKNPGRATYWTPPYEDEAGEGLVITAYVAVYEGVDYRGVIGVDLAITRLVAEVEDIHPTASGFAFYLDSQGELMATSRAGQLKAEMANGNAALAATIEAMKRNESGVSRVVLDGREHFIAHYPMEHLGGSLAAVAPVDELTAEAKAVASSIEGQADRTVTVVLLLLGGLFVAAFASSAWFVRGLVLRPLAELAASARQVGAGMGGRPVAVRSRDELGELAAAFNTMAKEVRRRNEELEARDAERTGELRELTAEAQARVRQLEAVAAVAAAFTLERPIGEMLAAVAGRVLLATGATGVAVVGESGDPPSHRLLASRGLPPAAERDIEALRRDPDPATGFARMPSDGGDAVVMLVPIRYRHRELGHLACVYAAGVEAPAGDAAFVEAIADQAAIAMENARLFGQASAAAALEERQRLARELHDSVSQALYGIALGAKTARRRIGDDGPANLVDPIDYIVSLAEAGLAEMRALIFELRPESLETEGLVAALTRHGEAARARHEVAVTLTLCPEPELPVPAKEMLYRVAQEAMHNVVKHARATRIDVSMTQIEGALELAVRDDGVGFDPAGDFPGHLGLKSMRERAEAAGATLDIDSAPGQGTTVTVRLPVPVVAAN